MWSLGSLNVIAIRARERLVRDALYHEIKPSQAKPFMASRDLSTFAKQNKRFFHANNSHGCSHSNLGSHPAKM